MKVQSGQQHRIIFVTGSDTGVGKTVATGYIARHFLMPLGCKVATVKLVETGNRGKRSQDVKVHRKLMGVKSIPEDKVGLTAPAIFRYPASPLLAAQLEGKAFELKQAVDAVNSVAANYDYTLVEGAGGLLVPLTETTTTLDLVRQCGWEVEVVACGRLGDINHALLTLEVLKNAGVKLHGVAVSTLPGANRRHRQDCIEALRRWLRAHDPEARFDEIPLVKDLLP